jgi:hypothetical protein
MQWKFYTVFYIGNLNFFLSRNDFFYTSLYHRFLFSTYFIYYLSLCSSRPDSLWSSVKFKFPNGHTHTRQNSTFLPQIASYFYHVLNILFRLTITHTSNRIFYTLIFFGKQKSVVQSLQFSFLLYIYINDLFPEETFKKNIYIYTTIFP